MPKKPKTPPIEDPEDYPQPEPTPEGMDTWTPEQFAAHARKLWAEIDAHVYTEEEKAAAKHFSRKQESAHIRIIDPSG